MKKIVSGALVAAFAFIGIQVPSAYALSCIDPQSMIEYYVSEDDYVIFTAEAGETKEYIKEAADPAGMDPNMQYNTGFTGQYVEVTQAHKGYPDEVQFVYYEQNSTWGYMCAGGPAEEGDETLYVVSQSGGLFELPKVVNSYPADSQLARDIIEALEESDSDSEPMISEVSNEDWQNRLRTDIMEMVFIIKVKLGELRFWMSK